MIAQEALHQEHKPIGLKVLRAKYGLFIRVKDTNIWETFTYLGSVVHDNGGSHQKALCCTGLVNSVMDSINTRLWRC